MKIIFGLTRKKNPKFWRRRIFFFLISSCRSLPTKNIQGRAGTFDPCLFFSLSFLQEGGGEERVDAEKKKKKCEKGGGGGVSGDSKIKIIKKKNFRKRKEHGHEGV